ncbi:MAG: hypothetical protein JXA83_00815, partial [Acidimicrobiales bacterium]|nr:hypothetical protein [Acidimicrobiales bacterium]
DDRLARAVDRAARLGIDVDADPDPDADPDADADADLSTRESAAVRAFTALAADIDPGNAADVTGATGGGIAGEDDHPLRPDAVLRGRPLSGDRRHDTGSAPVHEVEVPLPDAPEREPDRDRAGAPAPGTAPGPAADVTASTTPAAVDTYLLDVAALAAASGAFVTPWAWLFAVAVASGAGVTARSFVLSERNLAVMAHRAVRRVLAWLRPRAVVWFGIHLVRTAVLAVALPALACAGLWILDEGRNGTLVAARTGMWAHGLRTAAALVCFMLVAGVGDAHQRRSALVGNASRRLGRPGIALVAVVCLLVAGVAVGLVPRSDAGRFAAADGLGWAPTRVRDNIDRLRDDVVRAELHSAAGCLSDWQGVTWRATYTAGNPPGERDVARLVAHEGVPAPGHLPTAIATLHNQLAPWVEAIEVTTGGPTDVVVDRGELPAGRPLVDAAPMVGASSQGADALSAGLGAFDRAAALSCAAAPLP